MVQPTCLYVIINNNVNKILIELNCGKKKDLEHLCWYICGQTHCPVCYYHYDVKILMELNSEKKQGFRASLLGYL